MSSKEVHVPAVQRQLALAEVPGVVGSTLARAGLSANFPAVVADLGGTLARIHLQDNHAVREMDLTFVPDEAGTPVVKVETEINAKYVVRVRLRPRNERRPVQIAVCAPRHAGIFAGRDRYSIGSGDGYSWRLHQLKDLVENIFPGKQHRVNTTNLHQKKGGKVRPFAGPLADLKQEDLEPFLDPTVHADWVINVEDQDLPVVYFRVSRAHPEFTAYCEVATFAFEGSGPEAERILALFAGMFNNIPDPFNDDRPYGTKT